LLDFIEREGFWESAATPGKVDCCKGILFDDILTMQKRKKRFQGRNSSGVAAI
jgi:hypothetical protein